MTETSVITGEHINADGEFQSDKYDWCPPGFVPLKLTDPMAQPVLWDYARRRASVDQEFSDDLYASIRKAGYGGSHPRLEPILQRGPPDAQFEGAEYRSMERNEHGANILYWQHFPREQVHLGFSDRRGGVVDPDAGENIWSGNFAASAPGIPEEAVMYVSLFVDDLTASVSVRLDYTAPLCVFRLPRDMKLADFDKIEIGYYNMDLRSRPLE